MTSFGHLLAHHLVRNNLDSEFHAGHHSHSSEGVPTEDGLKHLDLPTRDHTLKLGIVGAGMAGLYAAFIIDTLQAQPTPVLKHKVVYEILEASDRIGGRCLTHKFSDKPNDFYDAGAMRFPHDPLMDRFFQFCKLTDTDLIPHYHQKGTVNCPMLFNGVHMVKNKCFRWEDDPFDLAKQLDVEMENPSTMLYNALKTYVEAIQKDFNSGLEKLMEIDGMSTREYLVKYFSENAPNQDKVNIDHLLQYIETFAGTTDLFTQSVSEMVFQQLDFNAEEWSSILGGTEQLGNNAVAMLRNKPILGKRVTKMALKRTENGKYMQVFVSGESAPREYATVISTATLGALSRIDLEEMDLNWGLRNAIRSCRYAPATKIAFKFKYPWWRTICGITSGGIGFSDNLLRWCVYPSYNIHDDPAESAVLLCSYTWTHDAFRFGSLVTRNSPDGEEVVKEVIIRELAALHKLDKKTISDAYITHHSYNWYQDDHASGACTSFAPGQFQDLYPYLTRPAGQGLLQIAGEATSAHHGWIVGSLESAYRAVYYFLLRFHEDEAIKKMAELFVSLPELDISEGTTRSQLIMGSVPEADQPVPKSGRPSAGSSSGLSAGSSTDPPVGPSADPSADPPVGPAPASSIVSS